MNKELQTYRNEFEVKCDDMKSTFAKQQQTYGKGKVDFKTDYDNIYGKSQRKFKPKKHNKTEIRKDINFEKLEEDFDAYMYMQQYLSQAKKMAPDSFKTQDDIGQSSTTPFMHVEPETELVSNIRGLVQTMIRGNCQN